MGWLSGWAKRVKLTADSGVIDSDLSDFPMLLHIGPSSGKNGRDLTFVFDELGSNSKKIAVTTSDGVTQCYVEIEEWDAAGEEAWLWVRAPSLSSSADTDFYLYFDSTHADNTDYVGDPGSTPAQNVWDSNFVAVYHMNDLTTSSIADSTSYGNNGTKIAANEPIETDGKIGKAQDFDGNNDWISVANSSLLTSTSGTVAVWVKLDAYDSRFVNKYYNYENQERYFALGVDSNGYATFSIWDATKGSGQNLTSTTLLGTTQYRYAVGTWQNGGPMKLYVDGTQEASLSNSYNLSSFPDAESFGIGCQRGTYHNPSGTTAFTNGIIDEVRISNIARSAAWIKASYHTGNDSLLTWGALEAAATGWLSGWARRKKQTITGTTAGAQTKYQMKITVHKGSGTDTATDVYCNGNCRDDFGDIRWADADGTTLVDYWIEELVSGDYAVFWVEIPFIPESPGTVDCYMYFDNPSATSTSDGDATFLFFDDFTGTSLDTSKWEVNGGAGDVSVSDGIVSIYVNDYTSSNYGLLQSGIKSIQTFGFPIAVRARSLAQLTEHSLTLGIGVNPNVHTYSNPAESMSFYCGSANTVVDRYGTARDYTTVAPITDYLIYEIQWLDGSNAKFYRADSLIASETEDAHVPDGSNLRIGIGGEAYGGSYYQRCDWVLVRKLVSPEPTWGAWGATEVAEFLTASARASSPTAYGEGIHRVASARASVAFVIPYVLFFTAGVRADESVLPRQVLLVPVTAQARPEVAVSPSQLLHLHVPASAVASESAVPRRLIRLSELAEVRASAPVALRQVLGIPELAGVRASESVSTRAALSAYLTASARASALVVSRQVLRLILRAQALVAATKTGKRARPDRYFPDVCVWYYDIDTGEILPETFE